jgi:signal transduction histidine kinase
VQRILEFARISKSEFKPQDINQIVNESILLTENHLRNSNIRHKKCLEDNLPPVLADKNKLQQVFLNLITNAAQAIVGEGTLTITTKMGMDRLGNDRVLVSFKDTGCGIEVENLGKIFDSFFTTKETGTGLGLAISKRIVDEHGGSISVESVVDRGTTVTVALPPIEDPARPGEWPKS